ncbi:MAG: gliding motility-associated C-terminal domain-containing protein [Bacteroidia bacterium]
MSLIFNADFASATHIVGGEMYYELLDADKSEYKITLRVFVDCENGSPQAIASDATAIIGVFDAGTRNYETQYSVSRTGPKRINEVNYSCVRPPSSVCVDEYVYTTIRIINPGTNGKILAFQRCCRNNTIDNIVSPQSTGATFWVKIPPSTTDNSSATFSNLPPNYVCVDAPLTFDHSATDPDGDSLVYFLNQPFQGATSNDPRPDPPSKPNYNRIIWANGYSTWNQVDGGPILTINSKTGELNVTPNRIGQYVIGIVVKEYRNGVLIGETYRDYQMNVIKCQFDILADFTTDGASASADAYVFECADTVWFKDRSLKADIYEWDFGDPTTTDDTSSQKNPWYVYPGNGDYRVKLKVINSLCEDEYVFTVRIRSTKSFELGPDLILCDDVEELLDTKTPDATLVEWSNGLEGQRIWVFDTGVYIATVSYDKCVYSDTMRIDAYPIKFDMQDDSLFCDEVDVVLDANISGLRYAWNTGVLDTLQTKHVTAAGDYIVAVSNEYCTEFDTIRIWQATEPHVDDAFYCSDFVHEANIDPIEEGSYLWSNGSTDIRATYTTGGKHWLQVKQRHCIKADSFVIDNPTPVADLGGDLHFCDQVDVILDAGDFAKYYWNTDQVSRSIHVLAPGVYKVEVEDEYGCPSQDSMTITVSASPTLEIGSDTTICLRSLITLGPEEQQDIVNYSWSNGFSDRIIETENEGWYKLVITDKLGCTATDSLYVTVDPEALPDIIYIPNAFTPNGDNLNDMFPYSQRVIQPGYYIMVFSRWGEKIFDSRDSESGNWDGTYNGKRVPNQTFIYYVEYFGCDGVKRSIKGTVNPLY